ncbi:TOPRIM nucleotidyl transferase/hydrolase domain-containing protein [Pseudomonas viridiflava]|uniref:TOPRIM nucleotidyl transferase/hydrolase domain-containing protein n=1 Tax=Pseudomonas viridiflava TaxID=33069 RepID=UPI00197E2426|nr:TOPRIM nucleotidyl transferase/hydrolase domain-containing protein [Pseudomonas viridiflava]
MVVRLDERDLEGVWDSMPFDEILKSLEATLQSIAMHGFDHLMDSMIQLSSMIDGASTNFAPTDKFLLYRGFWGHALRRLYENYLPGVKYEFSWRLEVTPYSLMLCTISDGNVASRAFDAIDEHLKIPYSAIEDNYEAVKDYLKFDRLGLGGGLEEFLPANLVPDTRTKQLNLIFRIMNFPPLEELSVFFQLYRGVTLHGLGEISSTFTTRKIMPDAVGLELSGALAQTYYCLEHSVFQDLGLEGLEKKLNDYRFAEDFAAIRKQAHLYPPHLVDSFICPCCGLDQEMRLPEEIAQYMLLMQNRELIRRLGLLFFDLYCSSYTRRVVEGFGNLMSDLNSVKRPRCLILVEGDTEEISIPIIALRRGVLFAQYGIKVFNSTSKQKLYAYFLSNMQKYPALKLVCLLDSDAKKEREGIARKIKGNKNKYHLTYIERGAYEDLFDLESSVMVLNEIYPGGEKIVVGDFDPAKTFDKNVDRILYEKKKAKFNKVAFAKKISILVEDDKIPSEILEVIESAVRLTKKKNFLPD